MTFDDYQKLASKTAVYPVLGHPAIYPTLGLAGEAGEVAEKVKKIVRDKNYKPDQTDIDLIEKELGDVLWYVSQVAKEFGLSLSDIADKNITKLTDRKERGKIQGSGDTR